MVAKVVLLLLNVYSFFLLAYKGIYSDANAPPIVHPYCLTDHKVLSTLEKPRESASAPTLEAAMPETSHRSSVSSRIQILLSLLISVNKFDCCVILMRAFISNFLIICVLALILPVQTTTTTTTKNPFSILSFC